MLFLRKSLWYVSSEWSKEAQVPCSHQGLGATVHTEFPVDIVEVFFDRSRADGEQVCGCLVRETCCDQAQDFLLAETQRFSHQQSLHFPIVSRFSSREGCQHAVHICSTHLLSRHLA